MYTRGALIRQYWNTFNRNSCSIKTGRNRILHVLTKENSFKGIKASCHKTYFLYQENAIPTALIMYSIHSVPEPMMMEWVSFKLLDTLTPTLTTSLLLKQSLRPPVQGRNSHCQALIWNLKFPSWKISRILYFMTDRFNKWCTYLNRLNYWHIY